VSPLLIAITSCHQNRAMRDLCRRGWLKRWMHQYPGAAYSFFVGRGDGEVEPDVVKLDVDDGYHYLNHKTRAIMRFAVQRNPQPKYIFKCDDDTWVHLPRLLELVSHLPATAQYVGDNHGYRCRRWYQNQMHDYAHGGAGYLLDLPTAQAVAEKLQVQWGTSCEDLEVGRLMRHLRVSLISDSRFQFDWVDSYTVPRPCNELITAHYVTSEERLHVVEQNWLR
jgi:hypothetical protein